MPKTVLIAIGVCLAVALAVAAPVKAVAPSTAAERIVNARDHHRPAVERPEHHRKRSR